MLNITSTNNYVIIISKKYHLNINLNNNVYMNNPNKDNYSYI